MKRKISTVALMIAGTVAMIGAIVAAIKASKEEKEPDDEDESRIGKVTRKAKTYRFTILFAVLSVFCFSGSVMISVKALAGTSAVLTATNRINDKYKEQVKAFVGSKAKNESLKANAGKEIVKEDDVENQTAHSTGKGNVLFYDVISETPFYSSYQEIRLVQGKLNAILRKQKFVSLQALYKYLRIKGIKDVEDLGWNEEDGEIEIGYYATVLDTGEVCSVLTYKVNPKRYRRRSHAFFLS